VTLNAEPPAAVHPPPVSITHRQDRNARDDIPNGATMIIVADRKLRAMP